MAEGRSTPGVRAARTLFAACGVWLVGLGLYFIFVRPALLPEDPRYIGSTLQQIRQSVPGLEGWLRLVFTVMGGFMASAGVLTLHLALRVGGDAGRGAVFALALAGAVGVGLMSGVNFVLHSDFRWLLLAPPMLWLAALVILAAARTSSN